MDPIRSKKSEISADSMKANRTSNGMDKEKVLDLAQLARIKLDNTEAENLSKEFDSILNYVSEMKKISTTNGRQPTTDNYPIRNIMREDGEPHESGLYTKNILENTPAKKGSYLKVKKIL